MAKEKRQFWKKASNFAIKYRELIIAISYAISWLTLILQLFMQAALWLLVIAKRKNSPS